LFGIIDLFIFLVPNIFRSFTVDVSDLTKKFFFCVIDFLFINFFLFISIIQFLSLQSEFPLLKILLNDLQISNDEDLLFDNAERDTIEEFNIDVGLYIFGDLNYKYI
jgi:hypothetical protein